MYMYLGIYIYECIYAYVYMYAYMFYTVFLASETWKLNLSMHLIN